MLKPATPLSVVLFIAFALLLLATLSTPVIKAIPLASYKGTTYGVFGFCNGNSCSGISVGYRNDPNDTGADFSLPANTRTSLSSILIVHPIACLFTLICFLLTVLSHLRGPGHSSRYLLGLIIFLLPTLLLSLLSFLIDILLFAPHQSWGTYLVLAATILIAISDALTCCMRRTLVSRKDQRKRIEENAEMNGDNYYAQQAAQAVAPPPLADPNMGSNAAGANSLPSFATFDKSTPGPEDDRIPLNERTATGYSGSTAMRPSLDEPGMERYGMGAGRGGPNMRGRGGRPYAQPRDEFGNPLPPSPALGGRRTSQDGYPRNMSPHESMRGRGYGGYPPRGAPRGGLYNGRGGPMGRGGIGPGNAMAAAGAGMMAGDAMGRNRGPPPGYGPPSNRGGYGPNGALQHRRSSGASSGPGYNGRQPSPGPSTNAYAQVDGLARAESPPPLPNQEDNHAIGQAIEMDERTGSPAQTPTFPPIAHPLRGGSGDVQDVYGSQQMLPIMNPTDNYSQEYVPARTNWTANNAGPPSNPPTHNSPPPQASTTSPRARRKSEPYYEDVDPRFSQDHSVNVPTLLVPGGQARSGELEPRGHHMGLQPSASYDSVQDGPLSESSNFTSISERGINPQWQSEQQRHQYSMGGVPNRQPQPAVVSQQRDFLLTNNPDFELGGARGKFSNRGGRPGAMM